MSNSNVGQIAHVNDVWKYFQIFICRFCLVIFKNADKSNSVNTISKPQNLFLTSPVKINADKLDRISIICGEYS